MDAAPAEYVAHDWKFHGWLPSGRGRYTCRACPARTTRGTEPPVTGLSGRCGSCPACGRAWNSAGHWTECLGHTLSVYRDD